MKKISKVLTALAEAANLAPFEKLVYPYTFFSPEKKQYLALSEKDRGFVPRELSHLLLHGKFAFNNKADVDS